MSNENSLIRDIKRMREHNTLNNRINLTVFDLSDSQITTIKDMTEKQFTQKIMKSTFNVKMLTTDEISAKRKVKEEQKALLITQNADELVKIKNENEVLLAEIAKFKKRK